MGMELKHEIVRDERGAPLEVRVDLGDGRIAITGISGGELKRKLQPSEHIPAEVAKVIEAELQREVAVDVAVVEVPPAVEGGVLGTK